MIAQSETNSLGSCPKMRSCSTRVVIDYIVMTLKTLIFYLSTQWKNPRRILPQRAVRGQGVHVIIGNVWLPVK